MDKNKLRFKGKIINDEFVIDPKYAVAYQLHKRSFGDNEVVVTMKHWREHKDKSLPQLGYYFGYMIPVLGDYFGYTKSEMHSALKYQILIIERQVIQKLQHTPSIENFSTVEMIDYMSEARQWASQKYGIYLNLPNEEGFDFEL